MSFTKIDTSKVKQYDHSLTFEALSDKEKYEYFKRAVAKMKLKNCPVALSPASYTNELYHDDYFVYLPLYKKRLSSSIKEPTQGLVAIPLDVAKLLFFEKLSNNVHERLKLDIHDDFMDSILHTRKKAYILMAIICEKIGLNVPLYYYDVDKKVLISPFYLENGTLHVLSTLSRIRNNTEFNGMGWFNITHPKEVESDAPFLAVDGCVSTTPGKKIIRDVFNYSEENSIIDAIENFLLRKKVTLQSRNSSDEPLALFMHDLLVLE